MARKKISQLESATDVTASDLIQIVDVEDSGMAASGTNKKATAQLLANELGKLTNVTATGSTTARSLANRFADVVNVKDFGAVGDGVADDTAAIQAAINSLSSGGSAFFPRGVYLTSAELIVDTAGITLEGQGCGDKLFTSSGAASVIRSSATTGSVIRFKRIGCCISNISIDSTSARSSATRDTGSTTYNAGLRFEADDQAGSSFRVAGSVVSNVKVGSQPNDGIIFVGGCFQSSVYDTYVYQSNGSGIVVDSGWRTGRTNLGAPGPVSFYNVVSHFNEGSGFVFGNPNDNPANIVSSLRITAINCESLSNNANTSNDITYENASWYIRGDHHHLIACAATGKSRSNADNHHIGIACAGRSQQYDQFRFLSVTRPIKVVNYSGVTNNGIIFNKIAIRGMTESTICDVSTPTESLAIRAYDIIDVPSVANFFTNTNINGGETTRRATTINNISYRALDFASTGNIAVNDDSVATIAFDNSGSFGIVAISGPTSGAKPSVIAFRVGTSNYCEILGGNMVATTGVLSGTTGSDAAVTVSTNSADNLLYIENRSGAQRTFRLTFLSMQNGTLSPT